MKIIVNGKPREFNIGCRSFIRVTQLLEFLNITPSGSYTIGVNGVRIEQHNFGLTQIKTGDDVCVVPLASGISTFEKEKS